MALRRSWVRIPLGPHYTADAGLVARTGIERADPGLFINAKAGVVGHLAASRESEVEAR